MTVSNTCSFRVFQVGIDRPEVITKLGGMGITNSPNFIDNFVIQHFLLQEVLPVCR